VKSLLILVVAISLGLVFFFYRRRLRLAVLVAGGLYLALTLARFVLLHEERDRFVDLGLALAAMGGIWLLTNLITGLLARRRRRRAER
jgi:hypothetical protein